MELIQALRQLDLYKSNNIKCDFEANETESKVARELLDKLQEKGLKVKVNRSEILVYQENSER